MSDGIYCLIAFGIFLVSCVIFGLLTRRIKDLNTDDKVMTIALIVCASAVWPIAVPLFLMGGFGYLIVYFLSKKK